MYPKSDVKRQELGRANDQMSQLAWLLEDMFRIPGLNWRFGLDSLLGLIPGAGDLVTGSMGLLLLFRAFQYQLPAVIIARMVLNTVIDMLIGAIPFAGDILDFAWKSNSMNLKLFQQYAREPMQSTARHWVFLALIALLFTGIFVGTTAVVYFLLRQLF